MRFRNVGGGFHRLQRLFPATVILAAAVLLTLWIAGGYGSRVDTLSNPEVGLSPKLPALLVQSLDQPQAGTFLVAARGLRDPNFSQTVVFLIDYDSYGAFGLIIDRPTGHTMAELWPEIAGLEAHSVYFGGPVFAQHPAGQSYKHRDAETPAFSRARRKMPSSGFSQPTSEDMMMWSK